MDILPISDSAIEEAVRIIHAGGIVAHATETCYGLACDLTNIEAVRKLFALKKRPEDQAVSALFSSLADAKRYVEWNAVAEELAEKYLPGPFTMVLPLRRDAPNTIHVVCNDSTSVIGMRISSHPVAQKLAELCHMPLSTTSANLHGKPSPYSIGEITAMPDLILDNGPLPRAPPSTVVDLSDGTLRILRQGGIQLR